MGSANYGTAVQNAEKILTQPGSKLIVECQKGDEAVLARTFDSHQDQVELVISPVPYSDDVVPLVSSLASSAEGRALLNRSVVVDPMGDILRLKALLTLFGGGLVVVALAELLTGSAQPVRMDLEFSIHEFIQKNA